MLNLNPTTPGSIDDTVTEFCKSICSKSAPIFVNVDNSQNYPVNECFNNVQAHVTANNGEQIFGWMIWYDPKKVIEAEFHCVWNSEDGELVDISPKPDGERKIVFLPDVDATWDKHFVPNKRKALDDDPLIHQLIRKLEAIDKLNVKYSDAEGRPRVPPQEMMAIERRFSPTSIITTTATGRNDRCPCNSGKKYKKCCGKK
ncbi:MAG: zinc-binding protein [Planctomycetota bacterium]|nr:MAG: zinc-binding protein [Planctomycetota bacterium]